MISLETLSDLFGFKVIKYKLIRNDIVVYDGSSYDMFEWNKSKNIYELMANCKESSYKLGYSMRTFKSSKGWVIDLIHEDRLKSILNKTQINHIEGSITVEIFDRDSENNEFHPKYFESEQEAVFSAYDWLLTHKDNL
jgi:hypothetical protein